jgi:hypothetical protein
LSENYIPKTKNSRFIGTKEPDPSESNRPLTKADLIKKDKIKLIPNKVKVPDQILNINAIDAWQPYF